ncbi:MAG: MTH1187 family thiamine-binding protein [Candidatus Latescibacteria bacterium]|nr:MTH1187 family thiamine-binding protein [Candidatus Latescibacterota bacterium]
MAIVDISVVPIGTKNPSVGEYVRKSIKIIKKSGLKYQVSSMGTTIEGDLSDIFELILQIHKAQLKMGAKRLLTTVKIDDRRDKKQTIEDKIKSATR